MESSPGTGLQSWCPVPRGPGRLLNLSSLSSLVKVEMPKPTHPCPSEMSSPTILPLGFFPPDNLPVYSLKNGIHHRTGWAWRSRCRQKDASWLPSLPCTNIEISCNLPISQTYLFTVTIMYHFTRYLDFHGFNNLN